MTLLMDSASPTELRSGDAELRDRLIDGDDAALALAYDIHGATVYAIARRVTGNSGAAEDVTQDVFVALWQRPESFRPGRGSLLTYLSLLAHRRSVDQVRSQVAREARENRVGQQAHQQISIEERVVSGLESQATRSSLACLPNEQRECLELAYLGGLTFREVAARLKIPEGTAKSRIRLGLKRLQTALSAQGEVTQ